MSKHEFSVTFQHKGFGALELKKIWFYMYCTRQLQAKIEKDKSFQWINTIKQLHYLQQKDYILSCKSMQETLKKLDGGYMTMLLKHAKKLKN